MTRTEQPDESRPNQSDPSSDNQGSHDRDATQEPGSQADRQNAGAQHGKAGGDAQRARQDRNPEQGTGGREGNTGQK